MIVLNICINQTNGLGPAGTEKFINRIKTMGVKQYHTIYTVPRFLETLEAYKNQKVLLFTNFSPNYFYQKNDIDVKQFNEKPMPGWFVHEYAFSAGLYYRICREYSFAAIHFITAASKLLVPDSLFLKITGNIPTTLKRKEDWVKLGANYRLCLQFYLEDRISETIYK